MAEYSRIEVSHISGSAGSVTVAQILDRKVLDSGHIQELASELEALITQETAKGILVNFSKVEFLSSAALNKLINFNKKVKSAGGTLVLTNLRPEIEEVFVITRLNQLFSIKETEADGLASF